MAGEGVLSLSLASVVEDVLRQHGARVSDIDMASRKEEEASLRRYEAAGWLRKMVGVVAAKDLPAEPSVDDFRTGLRSGIILCNVLNKIQPGSISKVVEAPNDSVVTTDGPALMAYQYFENVRNFLVSVEQMGLPTFEASDFEQGGETGRIVNCVLTLKAFGERKLIGSGTWRPLVSGRNYPKRNTEPFTNSISRNSSASEKSLEALSADCDACLDLSEAGNARAINMLVRTVLSDRRQDEVPYIVESLLSRVMEEYERRLASQNRLIKAVSPDLVIPEMTRSLPDPSSEETQIETASSDSGDSSKILTEQSLEERQASPHDELTKSDDVAEERTSSVKEEEDGSSTDIIRNPKEMMQYNLLARHQSDIQALKLVANGVKENVQFLQEKYREDMDILGKHLYRLTQAASGYQKVLAENRKLYNLVQDLKGNIRVYCRVRPFLPGQYKNANVVDHIDGGSMTIITPTKYCKEGRKTFSFNRAFGPTATQAEVFGDMQPLVRSVLDGYNVCIFAYGQTGSGKTFTMSGPNDLTEETYGVNYRALNDLFCISDQRKDNVDYEVSVQMMEIYNEQVRDLLATDGSNKKLEIRNSSQNGINVPDANRLPVSSTADVISLMNIGQKNRAVCSTSMNDRSSRSHSCLTVHVQGKDLNSGASLRGCMHLVDLAGSERVEKSEVTGDRLKEAVHINKSLSALGDVIASLAQRGSHIPYRNSKLTQLLQDSLGGQAKTLMFVHISPEPDAVFETLSTLKFAERVATVELGAARVNKDGTEVKELKDQIANLKAALAKKEEEPDLVCSSPDSQKLKSSLSHPQLKAAANIKAKNHSAAAAAASASKPRRRSLDPDDLSIWPPLNVQKEADDDDSSSKGSSPPHNYSNNSSSQYADVLLRGRRKETMSQASTLDNVMDEMEVATSTTDDSSDLDIQPLPATTGIPKVIIPNGLPSKLRKPQVRGIKTPPEATRSMIPAPSSRRLSLAGTSPPNSRNVGRPGVNIKRKSGTSK